MTVDVGKGFALPSGPSSLSFDKEEFMKKDFNVDMFVINCRKRVPLETLRDDLLVYLKILKCAMIELINKDYADFVNLSTNLVGMDKAISNLTVPLGQLREEVLSVRTAMNEAIKAVEEKLQHQHEIQRKKGCLQRLMNITHSVEKIEQLLDISHRDTGPSAPTSTTIVSQLSGQLIERVATEFNKLQFYVTRSKGLPLVEKIKPRIANITTTLQYSLEGSFLDGIEQEDVGMLRQCLRTYALIDKIRDAENLFRQHVVKPYMEEVISESFLRTSSQGLEGMFNKIVDFVPTHCHVLRTITCPGTSSGEIVRGYDFLVNAVWPEIVANLEARTPSIFAPGNPEVFHQKYLISQRFLDQFEMLCATQTSVHRLRQHPSYHIFNNKWSLPVYFQIRFQEIAGAQETAIVSGLNSPAGVCEWKLYATSTLWMGLQRCWADEVYLPALLHRFWKLSLQQMARYTTWLDQIYDDEMERRLQSLASKSAKVYLTTSASTNQLMSLTDGTRSGSPTPRSSSPQSQAVQDGGPGLTSSEPVTTGQTIAVLFDASRLQEQLPLMYETVISPKLLKAGLQKDDVLKESIEENVAVLQECLPKFRSMVTDDLSVQCSAFIRQVSDIPRLYRRTNREAPSKPSGFLTGMLRPLRLFSDEHAANLGQSQQRQIMLIVFSSLLDQFCEVTGEVLTSVKKMEESLKRLKKVRGSEKAISTGMSDDDKIRSQIIIDIEELAKQMEMFGVERTAVSGFSKLQSLSEEAKSDITTM